MGMADFSYLMSSLKQRYQMLRTQSFTSSIYFLVDDWGPLVAACFDILIELGNEHLAVRAPFSLHGHWEAAHEAASPCLAVLVAHAS